MTSLYFEKCIQHTKLPTKSLIAFSEQRRNYQKLKTFSSTEKYYNTLTKLCNTLRYCRINLNSHPLFMHGNFSSSNWTFELLNVGNDLKELYIKEALKEDELKQKNRLLLKALRLSNDFSKKAASVLFCKEELRACKLLNVRYHLAQSCSIAADRFFNVYKFQANYIAAKKAYQMKEVASLLWKNENYEKPLTIYLATAIKELTQKLSDDDCGEKVALLQRVVAKEHCPEDVKAMYENLKQQNEQVYYNTVQTDKHIETISLEETFDILSTTLEPPPKE